MFENFTVRTRITFLIGIIIIANINIALIMTYSFNLAISSIEGVFFRGVEEIQSLVEIRSEYVQNVLAVDEQVRDGTISPAQAEGTVREAISKINESWTRYLNEAKVHSNVVNNSSSFNRAENQMKEALSLLEKYQFALKQNNKETISKIGTQELQPLIYSLFEDLGQLTVLHAKEIGNSYQEVVSTTSTNKTHALIILLVSTLIILAVAVWIGIDMNKSLKQVMEIIHRLALGDLDIHLENCSKSETGQLLESMNYLAKSKRKITNVLVAISKGNLDVNAEARSEKDSLGLALISMIENLRHIIGEIQIEVSNLTISSEEVVSSVSQIATTSSETAAAVTEVTTSMEELKQTAQVAGEKANDVLANSEETLQVVVTGEKLIKATMDDMAQISEKMRTISEGIVKLNEHSQTIGEIIDTVNDLAEQSNLLAVNAAIEAAKAGEQGKGFSVVAQEIRALAEQSKSATVQVRSILNDIQHSTSSAVLATEQGSKAVEKGVLQSKQTNESMRTLSNTVTHMTQAANQIAMSTQQQFVGIDQVTVAMNNINEAVTLLVNNLKQIESAVTSFHSIGASLKEVADQYIMPRENSRPTTKIKQTTQK